jgi:hypothetical protein
MAATVNKQDAAERPTMSVVDGKVAARRDRYVVGTLAAI